MGRSHDQDILGRFREQGATSGRPGCVAKVRAGLKLVVTVLVVGSAWGAANACIWALIFAAMREGRSPEEVLYRQICGWYIGIISTIALIWVVIAPFLPEAEVRQRRR